MRPFTADETFLTLQGTIRWHNRSISTHHSDRYEDKQIRNLLQTSNVHSFLQTPSLPKDSNTHSSIKALNQHELHVQLTTIRNEFDQKKKRYSIDDSRFKELQRLSIERIIEEQTGNKKLSMLSAKLENLQNIIKSVEKQQEECFENRQVYYQILGRSKRNRVFLEQKSNSLKNELKRMKFVLEGEIKENYKERSSKSCSQRVYTMLNKLVDSEKKEKQVAVEGIFKDLRMREFFKDRREDRIRRYIEISELVANEAKDKNEIKLREGVLMHKLLAGLLSAKLSEMKRNFFHIEEAFLKIRVVTGETSIVELVQKFLTRENTFKDLKFTIDISRKSIEELNVKNNDIEKIINSATIQDKESRNTEFYKLKDKHSNILKVLETDQLRLHNMKVLYEHVSEWHKKMYAMLGVAVDDRGLSDKFKGLAKVTVGLIRSLKGL